MTAQETTEAARALKDQMEFEANQCLSAAELSNYLYLRDVTLRWLSPAARKLFIKHLTQVDQLCDSTSADTSVK
jgi:hypothetical protein